MPGYVSVNPMRLANPAAFGSGFLGPEYAPLTVGGDGAGELAVRNLAPPAGAGGERLQRRLGLLKNFEAHFAAGRPDAALAGRRTAYEKAVRMMSGEAAGAFDLGGEPAALRDRYGRNPFGDGCLLARRLVERGVPFVEVSLNGTDGSQGGRLGQPTADGFAQVKSLCEVLDPAWGALLDDLARPRVGRHAGRLDGRVRPHPADQPDGRPGPLPAGLERRAVRRGRGRRVGRRGHGRGAGRRSSTAP